MPSHIQAKHTPAPTAAPPAASQFAARPFEEESEQIEEQVPETKSFAGGSDTPPSEPTPPPADGGSATPAGDAPPPSSGMNFLDMPLSAEEAGVQTKLTIGEPGDKYEREADQTAAQVMRMPDPQMSTSSKPEANKPQIQRKQKDGHAPSTANLQSRLNQESGKGSSLPESTRSFMEPRFGSDFSQVRVHTDSSAVQMNKELGAKAFAYKNDIYFNAGQYNPSSTGGQELLAHELTHTIQQTGGIQRNKEEAKDNSTKSTEAEQSVDSNSEASLSADSQEDGDVIQQQPLSINTVSPRIQGFFDIGEGAAKREISERAEEHLPGYSLLAFIIGKDPFTEDPVARSATNFVESALDLVPNGDKIHQNLKDSGALNKAFEWLEEQIQTLNLTWSYIKDLFQRAWDSLGVEDVFDPMGALEDIKNIFLPPIERIINFLIESATKIMEITLEAAIALASSSQAAQQVMDVLRSAGSTFKNILEDPSEFLSNLLDGMGKGLNRFKDNIAQHLQAGLIGWLTGTIGPMGIEIPEDIFSARGVFSLVMQVLGLTWDYVRRKAVRMFGEQKVGAMEESVEMFQVIRDGGTNGLWEQIQTQIGDLKQSVMDEIKNMLIVEVIRAGVTWILSLFSPASGIVRAAKMIFDVVMFFIDRASQIMELVRSVTESISAIANGNTDEMGAAIENSLASAVPVAIGFMASLLGLGSLAKKVTRIIDRVRDRIDEAIEWVLEKVRRLFKKLVKKGKDVAGAITQWWKVKKQFKGKDGENHELFFRGSKTKATLMVASQPQTFVDFIRFLEIDISNSDAITAKKIAEEKAEKIDEEVRRDPVGETDKEKEEDRKRKQEKIEVMLADLAPFVATLMGLNFEEIPESKIDHHTTERGEDNSELALKTVAEILSRKGKPGSKPQETNPIYDKLMLRKKGKGSYYVRGHMLNENIHGPGTLNNLTPLSQEGNKNHLRGAEKTIKNAVKSGAVVKYIIEAQYAYSVTVPDNNDLDKAGINSSEWEKVKEIREAENHVPKGLTLSADLLKRDHEGKWIKDKALVPSSSIRNPIDTKLSSYQTKEGATEAAVGLKSATIAKLAEKTNQDETILIVIQNAAKLISAPIRNISQIANLLEKADGYDESRDEEYREAIDEISKMDRKVLKLN